MHCAELPQEIERHSLVPCYYFALGCPNCGNLRAALPKNPKTVVISCPACGDDAEILNPLGEGGTVRALPFWE